MLKAIFVSDIHMGLCDTQAKLLTNFLKVNKTKNLFLVGDIFDFLALQLMPTWAEENNELVKTIIDLSKNTNVIYVCGNHDGALRAYLGLCVSDIKLVNEYDYYTNFKHYLVCHGDNFDKAVQYHPKLSTYGSWLFNFLLWLTPAVKAIRKILGCKKPFSLAGELDKAMNDKLLKGFKKHCIKHYKENGYDGIICGHIHIPEIDKENNYYNCGDMVYNSTLLTDGEEGIKLVDLDGN